MPLGNEHEYVARVEKAAPEEFAGILKTAKADTERVLRVHFGDAVFKRMQSLAQNARDQLSGTVILLPGILGTELYQGDEHIWLGVWNLIRGKFDQLQMDLDGSSIQPIQSTELLKIIYGELQLVLLQHWKVLTFPYDWRLDIRDSARLLKAKIDASLGSEEKIFFVAHSMGGLVARSFLQQFPSEWDRVQRFVMIGTPNYGSFAVPALYNGLNAIMRVIATLDQEHDAAQLLQFAKMFVGLFEMMPFAEKTPDAIGLLDPAIYGNLRPPQERLDNAKAFQKEMSTTIHREKMSYIAGFNWKTPDAIADWHKLQSWEGYHQTMAGDGTVSHSLGLIEDVKTYFVESEHSLLPTHPAVIQAVEDILKNGVTNALPTAMPATTMLRQELLMIERTAEWAVHEAEAFVLRKIVEREMHTDPTKISDSAVKLRNLVYTGLHTRAKAAAR
jgi:pimeloyl-ACP methyl ester carboxylesterase